MSGGIKKLAWTKNYEKLLKTLCKTPHI
jgi:hypothetical protein